MHRCGRAAADECPLGGRTLPDMQPLIGITGEQKPASTLIDVLDVLRTVDIDIFYGDYARAVQQAGGIHVWIPADAVQRSSNASMVSCSAAAMTSIQPSSVRNPTRISGTQLASRCPQRLDVALEIDLPVLGVCRGVQLMNVTSAARCATPAHVEPSDDPAATHHRIAFEPGSVAHAVYGGEIEVNSSTTKASTGSATASSRSAAPSVVPTTASSRRSRSTAKPSAASRTTGRDRSSRRVVGRAGVQLEQLSMEHPGHREPTRGAFRRSARPGCSV